MTDIETVQTLLTCADVGAELGKSPVTIRALARKHNIGIRIGRDWIFTCADMERFRELPGPGRPRSTTEEPESR